MGKQDKILDKLSVIDTTLAAQHETLKEHIRRTELLESDVAPIKRHVNMVEGIVKFITLIALLAGALEAGKHLL
jgi:hypothetical protein